MSVCLGVILAVSAVPGRARERGAGGGVATRGSAPDVAREQQKQPSVMQKEKERNGDPVSAAKEKQSGKETDVFISDVAMRYAWCVCVSVYVCVCCMCAYVFVCVCLFVCVCVLQLRSLLGSPTVSRKLKD